MKYKVEVARRILRYLYQSCFASLVLIFIRTVFLQENASPACAAIVFVYFLASYIIRELAPNYFMVILLHLAYGAVFFILPFSMTIHVLLAAENVMFLIPSSVSYLKRNSKLMISYDPPWPTILIGFIFYAFGMGIKSTMLCKSATAAIVTMLALYFIILYVEGLRTYIEQTADVSGLPLTRIVSVNNRMIGIMVLCLLVLALLVTVFDYEKFVTFVGNKFKAVLQVVLSAIIFLWKLVAGFLAGGDDGEVERPEQGNIAVIETDSEFGKFLDIILIVAVGIVLLLVIIKFVVKIAKIVFQARIYDTDITEEAEREINISVEKQGFVKKLLKRLSREERARKIYKNKILSYRHDIHLEDTLTCGDLEKRVKAGGYGDIAYVTEDYEEVRYGGIEVDGDFLKKMSEHAKKEKADSL